MLKSVAVKCMGSLSVGKQSFFLCKSSCNSEALNENSVSQRAQEGCRKQKNGPQASYLLLTDYEFKS
jgi:hypothetical protein